MGGHFSSVSRRGLFAIAALVAFPLYAQQRTPPQESVDLFGIYTFHSQVDFSVPFMGLARVKGTLEEFTFGIFLDKTVELNSAVTLVIETTGCNIGDDHRFRHRDCADVLDV